MIAGFLAGDARRARGRGRAFRSIFDTTYRTMTRMPRHSPSLDRATPERIAEAALGLVDESGPEALTFRALAARLEISLASLQRRGTDLAGLDPRTRKLTALFNPRRHKWSRHFRWEGPVLRGLTPIGRVTTAVLHINDPFRVELRAGLIAESLFPPPPLVS